MEVARAAGSVRRNADVWYHDGDDLCRRATLARDAVRPLRRLALVQGRSLEARVVPSHMAREVARDRMPYFRILFRQRQKLRPRDARHYCVFDRNDRRGPAALRIDQRHLANRNAGAADGNAIAIDHDRYFTIENHKEVIVGSLLLQQSLPVGEFLDGGLLREGGRHRGVFAHQLMFFEGGGKPLLARSTGILFEFRHDGVSYARAAARSSISSPKLVSSCESIFIATFRRSQITAARCSLTSWKP